MPYYNECPFCGSTLDPGEKCDCITKVKESVNDSDHHGSIERGGREPSITEEMFARAQEHAKRKLARTIEREGDADGARLQPHYTTQLTVEAVREQSFSEFTILLCNAYREAEQIHREKEMPAAEAARQI